MENDLKSVFRSLSIRTSLCIQPARAGERGPEAGDEAVHVGVVRVAGVDGLVQRVHDAGDLGGARLDSKGFSLKMASVSALDFLH